MQTLMPARLGVLAFLYVLVTHPCCKVCLVSAEQEEDRCTASSAADPAGVPAVSQLQVSSSRSGERVGGQQLWKDDPQTAEASRVNLILFGAGELQNSSSISRRQPKKVGSALEPAFPKVEFPALRPSTVTDMPPIAGKPVSAVYNRIEEPAKRAASVTDPPPETTTISTTTKTTTAKPVKRKAGSPPNAPYERLAKPTSATAPPTEPPTTRRTTTTTTTTAERVKRKAGQAYEPLFNKAEDPAQRPKNLTDPTTVITTTTTITTVTVTIKAQAGKAITSPDMEPGDPEFSAHRPEHYVWLKPGNYDFEDANQSLNYTIKHTIMLDLNSKM
mmetsp:Transcript_114334/g.198181  ORF Transcript_114334/g.198181 Transcript_114334/m.198181 type:complete len:331 (+) Transcript_114334:111-1103(+)